MSIATEQIDVIIPAAGPITEQILPISSGIPTSMVPVNGKPIIGWILDELVSQKLTKITIALGDGSERVIRYIEKMYKNKANIEFCFPDHDYGLSYTIYYTLETQSIESPILIVLGDTIFRGKLNFDYDWIMYHEVYESFRWCSIEIDENNIVKKYFEKGEFGDTPVKALIGLYFLTDSVVFKKKMVQLLFTNDRKIKNIPLSSVLAQYGTEIDIKAEYMNEWYDCGSIDSFNRTKKRLLNIRSFNSIVVDDKLGTITKKSNYNIKFINEINWFIKLPKELQILTPRILNYNLSEENSTTFVQMEYYGYPTLAELWLYENINYDIWKSILSHLMYVIKLFKKHQARLLPEDLYDIYWNKTIDRFSLFQSNYVDPFFDQENIVVNKSLYKGFKVLKEFIKERIESLYNKNDICIIHGDFCFSNILYDVNNNVLKLLDPRGSFGLTGIYGDQKYDLAKLRHSICGFYDYIVNDLFDFRITGNEVTYNFFYEEENSMVQKYYDNLLLENKFNLNQIKMIEGLLFISMLPLHPEKIERQIIMYCQGIKYLNEVIDENIN
ncbi:MAG: sugar phosphate nucleotidyltransferase [Ignavibacteria bacterium]|jgi:NDP-sugar pyrophosphorylase family protein